MQHYSQKLKKTQEDKKKKEPGANTQSSIAQAFAQKKEKKGKVKGRQPPPKHANEQEGKKGRERRPQ